MPQKILRVWDITQIMRYKVLQFWGTANINEAFTLKGDFFEKLLLILSTSCTSSSYYNQFWTNWAREFFFFWKLTIISFVNLLCLIILKCLGPSCKVFSSGARSKEQSPTSQKFSHSSSYHREKCPHCRLSHHIFIPMLKILTF